MSGEYLDPYAEGLVSSDFYAQKKPVDSRLVVVLRGEVAKRGLTLITTPTRAVRAGDIHELLISDEFGIKPGSVVNRISYVGFVEILTGGVIAVGDAVCAEGKVIGLLAGFDYTHMPNHMNIVLSANPMLSGEMLRLNLDDAISFTC